MLRSTLVLLFTFSTFAFAVSIVSAQSTESVEKMRAKVAGHQLSYLLHSPSGEKPANGWPLLLFLHGYGECGDDIQKVKVHGPPKLTEKFEELSSCVLVSPQCPKKSWWHVDALRTLVEEVIAERGDIDRDRLYITGLSMGAYGTWSFLSHYPDYFAAAVPICGGGDPFRLPKKVEEKLEGIENEFDLGGLKKANEMPIWVFHGVKDGEVPIEESERLVKWLKEAGSKRVKLTKYPEAGHVEAWQQAYGSAQLWTWLFSK